MSLNPRHRNLVATTPSATGRASKPPLIKPNTGNTALDRWIDAATERFEIDDGSRNRPLEQTLTKRDLEKRLADLGIITQGAPNAKAAAGVAVVGTNGVFQSQSFEDFAESIRSTKLYRDLTSAIDDVNRFNDLPDKTKAALLSSIAEEASKRGAAIRRLDDIFQSTTESFAQTVEEITAAVAGAAAGVREVRFASASQNRATAGIVTQVQARLDNFSGGAPGTATVEVKMTAIADRATGLEAQYTLKVSAGGAIGGFGLAATAPVGGTPSSAFIIQADKFAIVSGSYAGGLTNSPPAGSVMFGVDSDGAFLAGNLKVGGKAFIDGAAVVDTLSYALAVNSSFVQPRGLISRSNTSGGVAMLAHGTNNAGGLNAISIGADAVFASGIGGTAVAVHAFASAGAVALKIEGGPMTIDNSTLVAGFNAEQWNGYTIGSLTTGTGVATQVLTNKPGGASSNQWLPISLGGITGYLQVWA